MKTKKNPSHFYDSKQFPQLNPFESEFKTIQNELKHILEQQITGDWINTFPDYVKSSEAKAWQVFPFRFFKMDHLKNQYLCPKLSEIIRNMPDLISCDFSSMGAKTHIKPHQGFSRMILRCHLPLIVPNGELCGIKVGDEIEYHKEGKLIVFDDSFVHEAWNKSEETRIVLMFDIPNPLWGYSAEEISKHKIEHLEDPFLLQFADKDRWLKALQEGVLPI